MRSSLPRIHVAIPALNEERYIRACLLAFESQTYPRDQVQVTVVVDSETTDGTVEAARAYGADIRIDDKFHTIGGATLLGYEGSDAEIFASTHADSEVSATWLETIARNLDGADGVGGPLCVRPTASTVARVVFPAMNALYRGLGIVMRRHFFAGPNYAYRSSVYRSVGGHNARLRAGEDNDLSIRAGARGARLIYDPSLVVFTSERRLQQGLARNILQYGRLFIDVNRNKAPTRFRHIR